MRSLAKGQRSFLLPGPTEAEPWEVWVLGGKRGEPQIVQICQTPLENRLRSFSTLVLPVAQVFCLPLWLNETDSRQFAGMIPLQLESRGLQPRNEPAVFDWSVVAQEEKRTLVLVGVLPASLPVELHAEAYASFDLSARYFPLAQNALTLWREHDRLVVAITRGASLVYYQALPEAEVTQRVIQDLCSVRATLEMQDILTPLRLVVAWTPLKPEERAALQSAFNVQVAEEEGPPPEVPTQAWKLTPNAITEVRRSRESRRWISRALLGLLLVYLAVIAWFAWQYVQVSLKVADLRKWQDAHAADIDLVTSGRSAWKQLGPVVDYKYFPLEILRKVQAAIPADQLHLTLFECDDQGKLQIRGEAKNVAGAFTFFEKLKADPYFARYNLQMGNPRPLPNDLASFQITEGNHATP
ncbi:MAG TPA: hypothetical protein VHY09_02090 [Candidatus Methylacidiphilales bacterium]|jgi:hypothetical protein|nr:hypothetical protein [Candidatus Methylacidiphilales bacterium]